MNGKTKLVLNEEVFSSNTGITDILIDALNSKWNSIRNFTSVIVNLKDEGYDDMIPVIQSILEDENNHVGQLQQLIELISPGSSEIETGKEDAIETIDNISEALKNSQNIKRNNKLIQEDIDGTYYVSWYEESPVYNDEEEYYSSNCNLISHEEFNSLAEATDYLDSIHEELINDGYERLTDEFYLQRSKFVGGDKFVVVESELGSEERSDDILQSEIE